MKARIKWVEDVCMLGEADSGHSVIMGGIPVAGGHNAGIRPMEMVLMGLGGCTTLDIINILKKQRQQVTDCVVEITAERREEVPKVFTKIHVHFIVTGHQIKENYVKQAVKLSAEKYCSVSLMLEKTVEISHDFEIIEVK
ncbi:MAG: OsmC family protein [Thiomargarita sp.]|nr:OsmC family protein [Thiomargarita sp.]